MLAPLITTFESLTPAASSSLNELLLLPLLLLRLLVLLLLLLLLSLLATELPASLLLLRPPSLLLLLRPPHPLPRPPPPQCPLLWRRLLSWRRPVRRLRWEDESALPTLALPTRPLPPLPPLLPGAERPAGMVSTPLCASGLLASAPR